MIVNCEGDMFNLVQLIHNFNEIHQKGMHLNHDL